MKHSRNGLMCAVGSVLICAQAQAAAVDPAASPFQAIVDRNLFGLKPLPPVTPPTPDPPAAPKITLTGIATILGKKQVLMKLQLPSKPGEQPKERSLILAEGEGEAGVDLLEVDVQAGLVKLKQNDGDPVTLSLEKDGAKLPATAPPVAGGPGTPSPVGVAPNPFQPAAGQLPQATPGMKSLPTRTLRLPSPPAGGTATPGAGMGSSVPNSFAGVAPGGYGAAAANVAINPVQANPNPLRNWPPETPMSAEEQIILMEAEREQNKNNPNYPPLPSTPLTPSQSPQSPAGNNAGTPQRQVLPIPGRPPLPQ